MGDIRMTQITAMVLRAVASGHPYGFEVMEVCALPSGTIYPALRRLEKAGLLHSRWENSEQARHAARPRRRTYGLTARGRKALPEAEAKLAEIHRMLGEILPASAREG